MKHPLDQMLSQGEILQIEKWSRTTLWRRIKDGKYPPPAEGPPNRWFQSAIVRHQAERRAAAGLPDMSSD